MLGLWAGTGGEGTEQWVSAPTGLRSRDVGDVLLACCDGVEGLAGALGEARPLPTAQECRMHLGRAGLRYAA